MRVAELPTSKYMDAGRIRLILYARMLLLYAKLFCTAVA